MNITLHLLTIVGAAILTGLLLKSASKPAWLFLGSGILWMLSSLPPVEACMKSTYGPHGLLHLVLATALLSVGGMLCWFAHERWRHPWRYSVTATIKRHRR